MSFLPNEGGAPLDPEQAELDSIDITVILDGFQLHGVKSGCAVTPGGNMQSAVAAGVITIADGTSVAVGGGNVVHQAAGPNPRFDLVVSDFTGTISVIDGTAGWSAVFGPTLPAYAAKVVLAAVMVQPTTVTIAAANIIDKRILINLPTHNALGGLVTGDPHTQYITKALYTSTGDLLVGSGVSNPARLAVQIPAANVRNVFGLDNGDTTPLWKTALDAVAPTASAPGDIAAPGTSLIFSHRDHTHGRSDAFAVPAIVLGTAAAGGAATSSIRSDATIVAFDVTVPTVSAVGDAAATGAVAVAARRDHLHGRESFAINAILLGTAAAAGAATTPFRSNDTIAAFDVTVPTTVAAGDAAAAGIINFAARRDHKHGIPVTFPATAHNILSATHGDALAAAVVRGDVFIGNSTPAWARLPIGVAGSILTSNSTDPTWANYMLLPTFASIGSVSIPANTTAGDLTAFRNVVGNDSVITGGARWMLNTASYVPGATHTTAVITDVQAPAGLGSTSAGLEIDVHIGNTAADAGEYWGGVFTAYHDNNSTFALTGTPGLVGLEGTVVIVAGATGTVTEVNGVRASIRPRAIATMTWARAIAAFPGGVSTDTGGTLTNSAGLYIANKVAGTTIGTQHGIYIEALAGGATNLSIRALGGRMRHVGAARFGVDADPSNVADGAVTAVQLVVGADAAFGNASNSVLFNFPSIIPPVGLSPFVMMGTYTPGGANASVNQFQNTLNLAPTAADAGGQGLFVNVYNHTAGAFNQTGSTTLLDLQINKTVGGTTTEIIGYRALMTFSAGTVANLEVFRSHLLTIGGTVTNFKHFDIVHANILATNVWGLNIPNLGGSNSANAIGIDIAAQSGSTVLNIGIRNAAPTVNTPSAAQTLVAATAILANATFVLITAAGAVVSTANPQIAAGADGQLLTILNVSANAITLNTNGVKYGNAGLGPVMKQDSTLTLIYSASRSVWEEIASAL